MDSKYSMWLSVWHAQCCLNVKTWLLQREQHNQSEQLQSVSCEKKVKECSEVHTFTRFPFPGLPTSYRFQKSPPVIHLTPLQRVPEHRGPTPSGATKEQRALSVLRNKDTRDSYWVIRYSRLLSFTEPVGSHFYPAGLTCAMLLQNLCGDWRDKTVGPV